MTTENSKEVLHDEEIKYKVFSSGYKDYVRVLLGDTEICYIKTTPENWGWISQELNLMAQAVNERQKLIEENESIKNFLESLTPGGSEFHNDPVRCFSVIKESIQQPVRQLTKMVADLKAERQKLIDSNRELLEALEDVVKAYRLTMGPSAMRLRIELAETAINNAKNI